MDDEIKVYRGLVPWSVGEHDWAMQVFMMRRKSLKGNLPLPEEYMYLKDEIPNMSRAELYNLNSMLLVSEIFHERYPDELEYNAHFFRFHEIKEFLHTHNYELFELGFTAGPENIMNVKPQLLESLCLLPFSLEETDEEGEQHFTFSFEEVVAATRAKLGGSFKSAVTKKEPSNKPDDLDKGFLGLIPWSLSEFKWVMDQHTKRGMGHKENEKLEDEYLPLKIQMMRQMGKNVDNFETMALLNEIFHERYSNSEEAMAHFFRYRSIFMFVDEYKDQLIKEGLADNTSGDVAMEPELIDSLCVLPYSLKETKKTANKTHAFLYAEVVAKAKALRSSRLN